MIDFEIQKLDCYKYAIDVVNGDIVACKLVKLACKRFLDDLERTDLVFKYEVGNKFMDFCSLLHLFEGGSNAVGKPVNEAISDWQKFWIYNLLCFYRTNGKRRYTKCLVNIARKQAKTMISALLGLWFLICDGEGAPLVCLSANSKEQAMNDFKFCEAFAQQLDPKGKIIKQFRRELTTDFNKGRLAVFSSESKNADGYNPYVFIVDEMGGADSTDMVDVWRSGQGARENPMGIIISSAGFDLTSPFKKMCDVGAEVLQGLKTDDSYFYLIFTIDENDNWQDSSVWKKSMPNLGVSVEEDFVKEEIQNAINNSELETSIKTKTFNIWCSSSTTWISSDFINSCTRNINWTDFDENSLCYVGIDLASTSDLTSVSFLFIKDNDEKLYFKNLYYLPEYTIQHSPNRVMYKQWIRQGLLTPTTGNVCDYDYILTDLMKHCEQVCTQKVGYDKWNSTQFVISATNEGLPMYPVSQAISNLTKPTKTLERLIKLDNVVIDNNEITRWCFENAAPKFDWNENIKIVKGGGKDQKIDGVIAMIMALSCYLDFPTSNVSCFAI